MHIFNTAILLVLATYASASTIFMQPMQCAEEGESCLDQSCCDDLICLGTPGIVSIFFLLRVTWDSGRVGQPSALAVIEAEAGGVIDLKQ